MLTAGACHKSTQYKLLQEKEAFNLCTKAEGASVLSSFVASLANYLVLTFLYWVNLGYSAVLKTSYLITNFVTLNNPFTMSCKE